MKAMRILALGTIFALGSALGLQAQATNATDLKNSVVQPEAKEAPAPDQQTTTPEKNDQQTAPATNDQTATPATENSSNVVCGAACS